MRLTLKLFRLAVSDLSVSFLDKAQYLCDDATHSLSGHFSTSPSELVRKAQTTVRQRLTVPQL